MINRKARILATDYGSANGNRTRILALKGLRANRCTIAPQLLRLRLYVGYGKWGALTSTTAAPRQWSPFPQGARPRLGHCSFSRLTTARPKHEQREIFFLLTFS